MEHTISTRDLRSAVGEVINTVRLRGDTYVIEQRGKPEAVLVPVHVYEAFKENRRRLIGLMEEVAQRNADRDPAEIDADIARAIAEVRAEKKSQPQ